MRASTFFYLVFAALNIALLITALVAGKTDSLMWPVVGATCSLVGLALISKENH